MNLIVVISKMIEEVICLFTKTGKVVAKCRFKEKRDKSINNFKPTAKSLTIVFRRLPSKRDEVNICIKI